MFWHQLNPTAKSIFLNYQYFLDECIQNTNPTKEYFFEKNKNDLYFATEVPFPLMNGIISEAYEIEDIKQKCETLKEKFKGASYPITWFWIHDTLPVEIEEVFNAHGLKSMGRYTSIALENKDRQKYLINFDKDVSINLVKTEEQFQDFLEIIKVVYGMSDDAIPLMARLYSAYKKSSNIKLYLASINNCPVSTLLSYQHGNILGFYDGATLETHRKKGLLTSLMLNVIKESPQIDYFVAQLMAAKNAKGVCDQLGFKEYSHFYPFCFGYKLDEIPA
jgi:hypothetical protein